MLPARADAPRVGLVLGAGGVAGGAFHAGVLAAIAEATGWDPRRATVVVGTSAGSITGASLMAGLSAADLIPGFYRPVSIDGELFVDGGAHSPTNADVLAGLGLDLVVVSSPMSVAGPGLRLALDQPVRRWSRLVLETEAHRLRRRARR